MTFARLGAGWYVIRSNWENEPLGYWLNFIVVSAADVGFFIFVLPLGNVSIFAECLTFLLRRVDNSPTRFCYNRPCQETGQVSVCT